MVSASGGVPRTSAAAAANTALCAGARYDHHEYADELRDAVAKWAD
jgi:hypothetical protein